MLGEQRKINPAAIPGGTQGMAVAVECLEERSVLELKIVKLAAALGYVLNGKPVGQPTQTSAS